MSKNKKSKFFVRILPTEDVDWENIKIEANKEVIHVRCLQDFNRTSTPYYKGKDNRPRFWSFQTDGVFYSSGQENIYETVMEGVIPRIYEGVNSVIMALGQTFSGKSFTMGAIRSLYEYRGIVPRFLTAIFSDIKSKTKEWKVSVGVSFVEIMGNSMYDLLSKAPTANCEVKNVSVVKVSNEEQALGLLFKGESHRRISSDAPYLGANCASGIVTLQFECLSLIRSHAFLHRAEVHFIDLAGIETVGKRGLTSFKNASDQGAANQAKYDLEQVLVHMGKEFHADQQIKKTSKLVEYLHSSLIHGCILRFIGHIRPTFPDLEVTLSTLKFGLKVKHIPSISIAHYSEPNADLMFENIKEELNQLKEQMLVEKLLSGSHEVQSGNFSDARLKHLERLANAYLQGWSSEVNVLGNTEHIVILKVFKQLFAKKNEEIENCLKEVKRHSHPEVETRISKSSRQSKKPKEEIEQKNQNTRKKSLREIRKTGSKSGGMAGKMSSGHVLSSSMLQDKVSMTDNCSDFKQENLLSVLQESLAPDISEKKIWEEYLNEQQIDPKYFDELAELIKKKKLSYEATASEYNDTRVNLERNRLALKEIAWKRHNGQNEIYDRFGQVLITQEERSMAKLVSNLEFVEKTTKKILEEKYHEWKEASKEFFQEKLKLEETFKEFCRAKYNVHLTPPLVDKYETPRYTPDRELESETSRNQEPKYYYRLQKKLIEKEMKKHKRLQI